MLNCRSCRRANAQPINSQSIAASDPILRVEWQKLGQSLLLPAIKNIALKLRDDEGEASDLGWKVAQLDTAKVRERNFGTTACFAPTLIDLRFDGSHLLICNHEEIARAARGIEDSNP